MKLWLFALMWVPTVLAAHPCVGCHEAAVKEYAASAMGRSITPGPVRSKASFLHEPSGSRFVVGSGGGKMRHSMVRNGITAEYPIEFAVGSGDHAQGYVVRIGPSLFQSPIAAYRQRKRWDIAPGYELMVAPDFNRRVTAECLQCHSTSVEASVQPITCERCHGETVRHLARPARDTIVNPARLSGAERDSVCEQCHLNGEARVERPGSKIESFQVGRRLEDFYAVILYDRPDGGLKVVSHVEQLARSKCQAVTSKLWCGSCHSAHGAAPSVTRVCQQCHPKLPAQHTASSAPCHTCHMPKRPARDGGHTAFTDHRIQRKAAPSSGTEAVTGLRVWRGSGDTSVDERSLGLAYISVGERDGSAEFLNRGHRLLAGVYNRFPRDADVLSSLGMVLFLKNQNADAITLLKGAIGVRGRDAAIREKLAVVLRAAGQLEAAKQSLEKAIEIDPSRETAYHLLADMQTTVENRRVALERYLRFNPQSVIAREALAKLPRP